MKVAFDIDDTLMKVRSADGVPVPDYDLIQVLRWFAQNGDDVIVWSGGGVSYAEMIVRRLGIEHLVTVTAKGSLRADICFDDMNAEGLATVPVQVRLHRIK